MLRQCEIRGIIKFARFKSYGHYVIVFIILVFVTLVNRLLPKLFVPFVLYYSLVLLAVTDQQTIVANPVNPGFFSFYKDVIAQLIKLSAKSNSNYRLSSFSISVQQMAVVLNMTFFHLYDKVGTYETSHSK
uniref:Uncharacterized protein n=1 Tax=Glossina brevipalpis TaxID=37001 RepID=A0A1A9W0A1_9MUSC